MLQIKEKTSKKVELVEGFLKFHDRNQYGAMIINRNTRKLFHMVILGKNKSENTW